jgi:hypothetical protein
MRCPVRALLSSCRRQVGPFKCGDSLLLPAGTLHVIENTGTTRLYCLTLMVSNQDFAELIRAGEPVALDDEDWAVLLGPQLAG